MATALALVFEPPEKRLSCLLLQAVSVWWQQVPVAVVALVWFAVQARVLTVMQVRGWQQLVKDAPVV